MRLVRFVKLVIFYYGVRCEKFVIFIRLVIFYSGMRNFVRIITNVE